MIHHTFDFSMPARMGLLGIRKRKITPWFDKEGNLVNPLPINWQATWELWEADPKARGLKKLVRHYNLHTNGYIAKWYYSKTLATYKWKSAYGFIPCRTAKTELGKALMDPDSKVDYYII